MQLKFLPKLLLILTTIFVFSELNAQIVNKESFDNTTFLPTGWSAVGTTNLWSRRTTGTFPTCTPASGAGMVRFASRGVAANTTQTISTPVIDYTIKGMSSAGKADYIYGQIKKISNQEEMNTFISSMKTKGFLSDDVRKEIRKLIVSEQSLPTSQ